ncbi:MAG: hypothetical protein RIA64_01800 [Rhodospirillales bacterium]
MNGATLTLVTPPPVYPVTDAEVWDHLRVNLIGSPAVPVDQSHIATLIAAAVNHMDGKDGALGRALVTQTWDYKMDCLPRDGFKVPLPPVQSVTFIKYIDLNGIEQTLSSDLYTVDTSSEPARIVPAYGETWPDARNQVNAVTVRLVCGYPPEGSPADYRANVPGPIKSAIKLLVDDLYQHRGTAGPRAPIKTIPLNVSALIAPYRAWGV